MRSRLQGNFQFSLRCIRLFEVTTEASWILLFPLIKTSFPFVKTLWDVTERSQSDLHWERCLRDHSETSQKRCLFCDVFKTSSNTSQKRCILCYVFKTSQKHLKKDVFCVMSLRRLEHISKKISFPWRLWDVSKTSLASIFGFSKILHTKMILYDFRRVFTISDNMDLEPSGTLRNWKILWEGGKST